MEWIYLAMISPITATATSSSGSLQNSIDPTVVICWMDTIAPIFFLLGLISAIISHFGYEFIGGMASRGKTRPALPSCYVTAAAQQSPRSWNSGTNSSSSTSCRCGSGSSNSNSDSTSTTNTTHHHSSHNHPVLHPNHNIINNNSTTKATGNTGTPAQHQVNTSLSVPYTSPSRLILSMSGTPSSSSSSSSHPIHSRMNTHSPSTTVATATRADRWVKSFLYGNQWSVRKSFFLHYYLAGTLSLLFVIMYWCQCEYSSVISSSMVTATIIHTTKILTPATIALYVLCFIHCVRRSYECYYIHLFSPTAKMHVLFYIIAIFYYILIPAIIFDLPITCHSADGSNYRSSSSSSSSSSISSSSTTVTTSNSSTNSSRGICFRSEYYEYITSNQSKLPHSDTASESHSIVAIASIIAVTGFGLWAQYQQFRHHSILANLRRPKSSIVSTTANGPSSNGHGPNSHHLTSPIATIKSAHDRATTNSNHTPNMKGSNLSIDINSYKIPMDGWFQYVTCPHYFAEVLLYLSYGILIGIDGRLPNLHRCIDFYHVHYVVHGATSSLSVLTSPPFFGVPLYSIFIVLWEFRYIVTFLFVVLNLQFAAIDNHNWYCMKFDNYSKLHRKTMFPFIY